MSSFEKLRDDGALDALLAGLLKFNAEAFLKLVIASPVAHRHIQKRAQQICTLAWGLTCTYLIISSASFSRQKQLFSSGPSAHPNFFLIFQPRTPPLIGQRS